MLIVSHNVVGSTHVPGKKAFLVSEVQRSKTRVQKSGSREVRKLGSPEVKLVVVNMIVLLLLRLPDFSVGVLRTGLYWHLYFSIENLPPMTTVL